MRRSDRAIEESEARDLLEKSEYGVLSTVSGDGIPYGVPLNYCVIDNSIYFHSATVGKKIDNIEINKFVSFCIVGNTELLPGKFATKYESVIVSGEVREVFNVEKQLALERLVHKYSPDFFDKGRKYIEGSINKTRVFKILINKFTGKARKQ